MKNPDLCVSKVEIFRKLSTSNRFFAGLKLDERYYEQEEAASTTSSRSVMLRTPSGTAPVGVMGAGLIGASGGIMVMTTNSNDGDPDSAEDARARRRRRVLNRK